MRLFVAIALDDAARQGLFELQRALKGPAGPDVRWTPPQQLHVTLKFLGEVRDADLAAVSKAVELAAAQVPAFEMQLAGAGCFGPRGPVRIVWAGLDEPTGTLQRCAEVVDEEVSQLGFPREHRPFSPHITIGRVKDDRSGGGIRSAVEAASFPAIGQSVDRIKLMSSVLRPQGPLYAVVSEAELSGT